MNTLFLLLLSVWALSIAARANEDLKLVNEFDPRQGCETLEIWLDRTFAEAANDSTSKAIVVIHQGNNFFDNAIVHAKAYGYVRYRGFPAGRYKVLLTKGKGDIRVATWLGKNGKEPRIDAAKLDNTMRRGISRFRLIEETIQIVQIEGRDTYISTGNPSCLYWFDSTLISELLVANPAFDAEFRIKVKSPRLYRLLVKILKRDFLENATPVGRLRFIYAGRDRDLEGGGGDGKYASITAFFVKKVRK